MKLLIFVLFLTSVLTACSSFTEPDKAATILVDQGYTHINLTGYRWFICGQDSFSTGFKAVSPTGREVSGAVCSGWNSGYIVRLD
jgi:hypothetical protein